MEPNEFFAILLAWSFFGLLLFAGIMGDFVTNNLISKVKYLMIMAICTGPLVITLILVFECIKFVFDRRHKIIGGEWRGRGDE